MEETLRPAITSIEEFNQTLEYIAEQSMALGRLVTGVDLAIDTVTIFSRDSREFHFIEPFIRRFGEQSRKSHHMTIYVDCAQKGLEIAGQQIKYLGLRQHDEKKPEVGYADYPVTDWESWQKKLKDNEFVRSVKSSAQKDLLEFRHPDFDVLGYMIDAN